MAERYHALLNSIDQGFCVLELLYDPDGSAGDYRITEVNAAFEGLTGLKNPVGKTIKELMPRHESGPLAVYERVVRTGRPERFVQQDRNLNGRWYDIYAFRIDGHVGVLFSDITERKKTERRQAYLLALGDTIRSMTDPLAVQEVACRQLGEELGADRAYYCEVDEPAGAIRIARDFTRGGVSSLVGQYSLEAFGWVGPAFRSGGPMVVEDVATTPLLADVDRPPLAALPVGAFVAVPLIKDRQLVALLCVTDVAPRGWSPADVDLITETAERTWAAVERARAEGDLFRSRETLRAVLDSIPQRVFWKAPDLTYLGCNRPFASDMGFESPYEVIGKTDFQGAWAESAASFRADDRRVIETGIPKLDFEEVLVASDGTRRWVRTSKQPLRGPDGRVTGVLGTYEDVTERHWLEERLREQEALLRETAEMANVGGWSFDPVTGQSEWTEETFRIHNLDPKGPAEPVNRGIDRFPEPDRARLEAAVQAAREHGTPYDLELRFVAVDGEQKWVRSICRPVTDGGKVLRVRGSIQDVTARHVLEEKLRQSQKMDAFGQLAGGVAHDFNNMLQVINGYAALLLKDRPVDDPNVELVSEIRKAGERSAALTRQLLAFARQEVVAPRVLDLSAAAGDTSGMLRRLIGEDVRLVADLGPGVWPVLADPGQLEQVLLNLAVNARDAMPDGGTLTVAARNETVTGDADVKPGQYAVLSVTDTGTGMSPEVLARVFEPFFTTKEVGKGTGLGLATVYGIVRQAGGHLRVRSKVGVGSTFEVFLPRTGDADQESASKSGIRAVARGAETILVVEDEAAVRGLVKMVLSKCGYKVLVAADGTAAGRVAAEHAGPIHLVLSDVVMPGAGGRAAAAGVTAKHPEAKVMFMSGYTDDAVVRRGVSAADMPFIQKPFEPDVLAAKVRQVLDSPH